MKSKLQKLLIEFSIYAFLFCISLFIFPICNFYYLGENDSMITEPQYFNDFIIAYIYPIFFLLVISGFLTLNKRIIVIFNTIVVVLLVLIFLMIYGLMFGIGWGASPFHPEFQLGFLFCNLFVILVIARTYYLKNALENYHLSKKLTRFFSIITFGIPLTILGWIIFKVIQFDRKSRSISSHNYKQNEKNIYVDGWKYPAYNDAYVDKYYSQNPKNQKKYILDSVEFTIMKDLKIEKEFTKKAIDGKLDIEAILEENE